MKPRIVKPLLRVLALLTLFAGFTYRTEAGELTIAAAADLKYALEEMGGAFRAEHPNDKMDIIFGSSGKFHTQIQNGAPFDLFFSADIAYPRELRDKGLAATPPKLYAIGRIVLWSLKPELAKLPLKSLPTSPAIRKFAIANPDHAPYGRRAQEALQHEGVWDAMKPKLVLGENIAHTSQYVDSGAAEAGIVALSLVKGPALTGKGAWTLIPSEWHAPLEQAYVITARARDNPLAAAFANYMETPAARAVMRRYGFVLPGE
ncbi:MAG: molybdate ABC transporter substrate-binding protein [Betaproteobacteria bacterium CG2_30_59_46]|nr:MAG: molybdate ABC transporter substrate-binding protein [Betaproteobacteria bacterium CG2_30_59_46]PIQ13223.1 MAG: molybdate ABC transporter substrate-binding protein [Hydrogenophilales bacterium CG18_big_fil_WC_8_21_14_2_50_58_12]PIY00719.1 MAG: molybdate ABC transporter substrate-binding protein [Hydrogenophilales bacterium CG_4_10_14_3_um_filter_58_23]PJB06715.1 MAG: molybdate ABC transporter substrate-binding protein [Hydrogenophilales bacterium CG_4_9_14_3_um_filter_59_35]